MKRLFLSSFRSAVFYWEHNLINLRLNTNVKQKKLTCRFSRNSSLFEVESLLVDELTSDGLFDELTPGEVVILLTDLIEPVLFCVPSFCNKIETTVIFKDESNTDLA